VNRLQNKQHELVLQVATAVRRGYIDASLLDKQMTVDILQNLNVLLQCSDQLDQRQDEQRKLQQQVAFRGRLFLQLAKCAFSRFRPPR